MKTLHMIYDIEGWAYWNMSRRFLSCQYDGWKVTIGKDFPDHQVDVIYLLKYAACKTFREKINALVKKPILVVSFNAGGDRNRNFLHEALIYADYVVCINEEVYKDYVRHPKTVHIPHAYAQDIFYKKVDRRSNKVLWTGSIYHQKLKGYYILKNLEPEINKIGLDLDMRLTDSLGSNVISLEAMSDWYNTGHIYVVASQNEGTPNTGMEAAACGNILVSTKVGVMPQLIQHEFNGILVDRNEESILAGIKKANELGNQLSERSTEDVLRFSWSKMQHIYFDFLSQIIDTSSKS